MLVRNVHVPNFLALRGVTWEGISGGGVELREELREAEPLALGATRLAEPFGAERLGAGVGAGAGAGAGVAGSFSGVIDRACVGGLEYCVEGGLEVSELGL